jgi:hypothetical protein
MRPLFLIGGCLGTWLLVALPARALGAPASDMLGTLALAVLCMVPAAVALAVAERFSAGLPQRRILIVLGSTGIRMFLVLGIAWALYANVPFFHEVRGYWLWLIVFYLGALALEVCLLLAGIPRAERQANMSRAELPGAAVSTPPPVLNGR